MDVVAIGDQPAALAAADPLLKRVLDDVATVVTRAATIDNTENLAPTFVAEMTRRYAGTALGRQELLGELVDDLSGSLWRRDWIDEHRVANAPELATIVVAVDPPVTATATSDACGIVVAGLGPDGRAYVIDDRTLQGREPQVWARAAGEQIVQTVQAFGGLLGTILTIYGRLRASQPLEQRSMMIKL